MELIFPVQFPKRMLYTNHPFSGYILTMIYDRHPIKRFKKYKVVYSSVPLELYPSRVFRQAVFHVLG